MDTLSRSERRIRTSLMAPGYDCSTVGSTPICLIVYATTRRSLCGISVPLSRTGHFRGDGERVNTFGPKGPSGGALLDLGNFIDLLAPVANVPVSRHDCLPHRNALWKLRTYYGDVSRAASGPVVEYGAPSAEPQERTGRASAKPLPRPALFRSLLIELR